MSDAPATKIYGLRKGSILLLLLMSLFFVGLAVWVIVRESIGPSPQSQTITQALLCAAVFVVLMVISANASRPGRTGLELRPEGLFVQPSLASPKVHVPWEHVIGIDEPKWTSIIRSKGFRVLVTNSERIAEQMSPLDRFFWRLRSCFGKPSIQVGPVLFDEPRSEVLVQVNRFHAQYGSVG